LQFKVGNCKRGVSGSTCKVGDHKPLEFFEEGRLELYNLRDAIGQQRDLAKEKPELTRGLHAKLKAWRAQVDAPMPGKRDLQTPAQSGGATRAD